LSWRLQNAGRMEMPPRGDDSQQACSHEQASDAQIRSAIFYQLVIIFGTCWLWAATCNGNIRWAEQKTKLIVVRQLQHFPAFSETPGFISSRRSLPRDHLPSQLNPVPPNTQLSECILSITLLQVSHSNRA
jgi:hypothetical protein